MTTEHLLADQPNQHRLDRNIGWLRRGQGGGEVNTHGMPEIVCICGSTRFKDEMLRASRELTLQGHIVVMPGVFGHSGDVMTDEQKVALDALHLRKIDLADWVCVVAVDGYVGESTRREIEYAAMRGKYVAFYTSGDEAKS